MPKKTPLPVATGDIETDPFRKGRLPVAFATAIHTGERTFLWWGPACIIDMVHACVKDREHRCYYLHNGGKFDLHFLLAALINIFGTDGLELLCIGPRLVQIVCVDGNKDVICEFRDSFSIIPKALKDIGGKKLDILIWKLCATEDELSDRFPTKKDGTKGDERWPGALKQFSEDKKAKGIECDSPRSFYKDEICKYLRRDVSGLHEAVTEFFNLYGNNMTLASAAFKILTKKFNVPRVSTTEKFDDTMRNFYFAGHVEFFGLGKFVGDYKICDINSAFPRAMMEKHWFSSSFFLTSRPPEKDRELCFYKVRCKSEGALPFRTKGGGVCFPKTEGEFFATGWELFAGIELGLVTEVEYIEVYRPIETRDFRDYVNHFYELKKNAETEAERNFAKLFLNAAYGKYALNPRSFRDTKITLLGEMPEPEIKMIGKKPIILKWEHSYDDELRGLSFWKRASNYGQKPLRFYNVATAASITGWVRAFLLRSMKSCEGVLYCDTDSIIALDTSKLSIGKDLGEWKLEKECDEVHIAGKKLYCARDKDHEKLSASADPKERAKVYKTASKGVRLSAEQIISVAMGNEESFSFDAPNYSVYSKQRFTSRRVNRDDKRKRK